MNQIATWLQDTFGFDPETQRRLLASIVAIAVVWAIRRIVIIIANRQIEDLTSRYRIRKTSLYIAVPIGILIVGRVWFEG